jgi:hypothetical protein
LAIALTACTGGEVEAEVGGAALERDDDGQAVGVDDERGATAEEEGLVDDGDPEEQAGEDGADDTAGDDVTDEDAADRSGASSRPASPGPTPTSTASPTPAPTRTPTPTTSPVPTRTPAAPASPAPSTPAPPVARVLTAGPAEQRSEALGLGDEGWVVTSSAGPIEPGVAPPPFRVDVDVVAEGADPIGGAVCAVTLQAADDRGLSAEGLVTVRLVLEDHEGARRLLTRQLLNLDVTLAAGRSHRIDPSAPLTVDARELAKVTCEAVFEPR